MIVELFIYLFLFVFVCVPNCFLSAQILLGLYFSDNYKFLKSRSNCIILIPAHNEEVIIGSTLEKLLPHLISGDRVIVVADNCDDATAEISRSFNRVEVLQRTSSTSRGKGFALDYGMQYISKKPAETIVIFDADCEFEHGSLDLLVKCSQYYNRIVQSRYLMKAPPASSISARVSEFAWLIKNQLRPLGRQKMGIGCQLQGSGMAFPWELLSDVSLASSCIVEDLELGLTLSEKGEFVLFEYNSIVKSEFPSSECTLESQRTRWEHGHIALIFELIPRFIEAVFNRRLKSALMMLDAMIPPTVFWLLFNTLLFLFSAALVIFDVYGLLYLVSISYAILLLSLILAWFKEGRDKFSINEFFGAILYVVNKFNIYKRIFCSRDKKWVKTKRD